MDLSVHFIERFRHIFIFDKCVKFLFVFAYHIIYINQYVIVYIHYDLLPNFTHSEFLTIFIEKKQQGSVD